MATIQAHEQKVLDVFGSKFAFRIPTYQRPYSWGTQHAKELFDDLCTAAEGFDPEREFSHKAVSPYFLGSVVLIKDDDTPDSDVIDGQQRLTTLSLLIGALGAALKRDGSETNLAQLIFEKGDSIMGRKDRCRLTLRDRDHEFYEKNILRDPALSSIEGVAQAALSDPQRRLIENAIVLTRSVDSLRPEQRKSLAGFLLQCTYLVVVTTPDLESAFRIFSVMNDRGLNLSASDILKAEIIGKIPEGEQAKFVFDWEAKEEELGTENFSELFSHIRMIHGRSKLRKSVLEGVRESVPLLKHPKRFIEEELIPSADVYAALLDNQIETASPADDARINRILRLLGRLDDTDWVPPAIYFLRRNQQAPAKIASFLTDLERLAASMWLRRTDINGRIRRYARVLDAIEKGSVLSDPESPLRLEADEISETLKVLDGDVYNLTPKKKRTMVLLRLDEALSSGEATYDYDRITVEHVLPQTPDSSSQWCQWWPNEDGRLAALHRIGNLALLNRRQNSAANNWDFSDKKYKYFMGRSGSSPFAITTELVCRSTWTPEDFEQRQGRFVAALAKEWSLLP